MKKILSALVAAMFAAVAFNAAAQAPAPSTETPVAEKKVKKNKKAKKSKKAANADTAASPAAAPATK